MSNEIDDLKEFNDRVMSDESDSSVSRVKRFRGLNEIENDATPTSAEMKDTRMWAIHGKRNYSPCEAAVPMMPAGQYTIVQSQQIGIYFSRTDTNLDDLVALPDSVSEQVIREITTFWTKESHFRKFGFLWKRGVLMWGPPGSGKCLKKDTPVLMFDGSIKLVQDIVVGDQLMGDDSTSRNVLSLARGREELFDVHQTNGDSYGVNKSHILSVVRDTWKKGRYNPHRKTAHYVDISVTDYINTSPNFKKEYFGYKASIDFPATFVSVDPYYLGLWLGDGTSCNTDVTTGDPEVVEFLAQYATTCGLSFVPRNSNTSGNADTYAISGISFIQGSNQVRTCMQQLGVLNNKHIPESYKINSRSVRLQVLAGLLDSDGHLQNNCFEFSNTNERLATDVVFLARSLGFKVSISKKQTTSQTGTVCDSFSVHISGFTDQIPTLIPRKQATARKQIKNPLHASIRLESLGEGDYYGFEIDGNHRFVLGDFTVTHNTSTLQVISGQVVSRDGIAIYVDNPGLAAAGLKLLRQIEPKRPLVVMLEDIDSIIDVYGESDLLALMDGELQIDNVVFVATTNYPERLDKRFINRPSRFDIVKKIGMPNEEARSIYLKAKCARLALEENGDELNKWVELSKDFSIAHLKELIVSVEVFEVDLTTAVKRLKTMMDYSPRSGDATVGGKVGFTG